MPEPDPLIIDLGDLAALAAAVTRSDPSGLLLWHPVGHDAAAPRREAAAREHAELLGVELIVASAEPGDPDEVMEPVLHLLRAARVAASRGRQRIVWPAHSGLDGSGAIRLAELAAAAEDLLTAAGAGTPAMVIDVPLIELETAQVLDLVADAGAPIDAHWPCSGNDDQPCGECPGCRRWRRAGRELGLPWPWEAVTTVDVKG